VMFRTDQTSYHGHPNPLACPPGTTRKSIALYYFTQESKPVDVRATEYRALPTDPLRKKIAIAADQYALRIYDFLKRKFGLSDRVIGPILRRLFK